MIKVDQILNYLQRNIRLDDFRFDLTYLKISKVPGNIILVVILLTLSGSQALSLADNDSTAITSHYETPTEEVISEKSVLQTRSFEELELEIETFHEQTQRRGEFTHEFIEHAFPETPEVNEDKARAAATFDRIEETGNYVEDITTDNLVELPVGIKKTIDNVTYIVGISKAKLTPTHTDLTVFVKIVIPQTDATNEQRELFFGFNGIKLSHDGGIVGDWNLVLLGDFAFSINGGNAIVILKGGFDMESGDIDNKTYVTIDCEGFKELRVEGEVQVSRSLMEPLKEDYTVDMSYYPPPRQDELVMVSSEFALTISDWNDILVEVSLQRFQMTSTRGTAFEVTSAVLDFSDSRNSVEMQFPEGYEEYLIPGQHEAWRGIYVASLEVVLPEQFRSRNADTRIKISANNMLIDGMGLSGNFAVDNVLPLDEGVASGWQFSLDHMDASIIANSFVEANLNGKIVLPVSEQVRIVDMNNSHIDRLALQYNGIINPVDEEYLLTVSNVDSLNFDIWNARATITPNSYVELGVSEGEFRPKAVLHGYMHIQADNGFVGPPVPGEAPTVDFPGIVFQNLQIQGESPYLSVDHLGYTGEVKLVNFPVTISDIHLNTTATSANLSFDLAVNLMQNRFGAETGLVIKGTFGEEEGLQRWKFDRLDIDELTVNADLGGVQFIGSIQIMDDDPVYGNGFKGSVSATYNKGIRNVTVTSNAIFGRTEFRYWYLDGMVDNLNLPTGTIFAVKGFGGGAYYRMKKVGFSSDFNATRAEYLPDENSSLGIKAMILFALEGYHDAVNGGAGFEIAFNNSGGINRISIYGEARIMVDFEFPNPAAFLQDKFEGIVTNELGMDAALLNQLKETNLIEAAQEIYPDPITGRSGINAYAAIEFDFVESSLHGSFDLYIDVIGGIFRGLGPHNRAGWAEVHFGPGSWYIRMGTPTDPIGVRLGLGPIGLEIGSYFMIGDDIPDAPPPPAIVAQILGTDIEELNYMRDENALEDGRGFAFGASLNVDTGDITFLVFYARFQAGIGFDIMLRDYGDAECQGGGQVGINGWYTNGQSYAYLQGELGIKIKLFFIRKKIPIITAGAAVLLQTKLPNPAWFRGYLGGHFNLLGGLIKGRFRFKIELGDECEFVDGGPLEGLKIIADINPINNATNVDVFTVPQVGFNMTIEQPFELLDEDGNEFTYRIKLDEMTISDQGNPVQGELSWNNGNDLLSFTPFEILPPETQLHLVVKVSFEERRNGTWHTITENGQPAQEIEERTFTTGVAPDYIPMHNVAYSYPVIDQKYFYKNERNNGYVQLNVGQSYLFDLEPGYTQRAVINNGTSQQVSTISYTASQKRVNVNLPSLSNSQSYMLTLETVPPSASNSNFQELYVDHEIGYDNELGVKSAEIEGTVTVGEVTEMLSFGFNTSQYNTFEQKMNAKNRTGSIVDIIFSDVHSLEAMVSNTEPFDLMELNGDEYTEGEPLVRVEAVLDDNYYVNEIYPLVYQGYPLEGIFTVDRDPLALGIPPAKAVEKLTWYMSFLENNPTNSLLRTRLPYRYYLAFYYKEDFLDIQYKVVNAYMQDPSAHPQQVAQYDYIINGVFPYLKPGNYKTNVQYVLPGGENGSSKIFTFNRPN